MLAWVVHHTTVREKKCSSKSRDCFGKVGFITTKENSPFKKWLAVVGKKWSVDYNHAATFKIL